MFHFHKTNVAHRMGLTVGALFGIVHAAWALLVAAGYAKSFADFIEGLHFMKPTLTLMPFSLGNAVLLVVVTSVVGYALGRLGAGLWIAIGKKMK